jgi:very-short-patch-repair endonuclease
MHSTKTARNLRRRSTWAEKRLWSVLRSRRLAGYKFRRQDSLGPYILDFYCAEAKFAVELDGSGHGFAGQRGRDAQRDAYLNERGIQVKRVWNNQLARWESRENLVSELWHLLQGRVAHPGNLPLPPYRRAPDKPTPPPPTVNPPGE